MLLDGHEDAGRKKKRRETRRERECYGKEREREMERTCGNTKIQKCGSGVGKDEWEKKMK